MLFDVDLITYRGLYKTIQTTKLNVLTNNGRRTVLSNHMPIILPLELGVIETSNDNGLSHFAVSEGMLYFENNKGTIVCDLIEDIEDVDIAYYEKRLKDAKDSMSNPKSDLDYKKAKIKFARATNVLKAAKKTNN